ncbi:hypothetical protein D3C80_1381770 [compost metagenome]
MAAFSGWVRSWLTAARKRLLEWLARSTCWFTSSSWRLSSESSWVRSATRASRCSLASRSTRSAARKGVMSVKVITKPPAGMGLPCISITRPSGRSRAETWGLPRFMKATRRATWASMSPGPQSPCSAL